MNTTCPECNGTGEVVLFAFPSTCKSCGGTGVVAGGGDVDERRVAALAIIYSFIGSYPDFLDVASDKLHFSNVGTDNYRTYDGYSIEPVDITRVGSYVTKSETEKADEMRSAISNFFGEAHKLLFPESPFAAVDPPASGSKVLPVSLPTSYP